MKSKAPLMLIEQMILLAVFAFAAALCMQAFVKSDAISKRSEARDQAVVLVETAAETLRHNSGDIEKTASELGAEVYDNSFTISYDENMEKSDADENAYTLKAQLMPSSTAGLGCAYIYMSEKYNLKDDLFSVTVMWQEVNPHEENR